MPINDQNTISLGANRIDPLTEHLNQQRNNNDTPADPDEIVSWIVQFLAPLTAKDVARIRKDFSLALTDFVPASNYIERLPGRVVDALRADPAVRAVARYVPRFKASDVTRTNAAKPINTNNNVPEEAPTFDAVLFPDANVDRAVRDVTARGASAVQVLDDRAIGGSLILRFQLADPTRFNDIAEMEAVRWLEQLPETVDDGEADRLDTLPAGFHPLTGEGQVLGHIDNGQPDLRHCFFRDPDVPEPGPGHRKVLQVRNALGTPPSRHATFTAGCAAGDDFNQIGAAPDRGIIWAAKLVTGNRLDLDNSSILAELTKAGEAGARIHTNSYHSKPQGPGKPAIYDERARMVDAFTWTNEDHLVVASSGNSAEEQGPPGTAKNALCVSCAATNANDLIGDGAPGPTADGRLKPDLAGVGCHARSAVIGTLCETGSWSVCASSFATPKVAAAAVIARQYFSEGYHPSGGKRPEDAMAPSGALLKAVLLNTARPHSDVHPHPNPSEGWGTLVLANLLPLGPDARCLHVVDVRNTNGLEEGGEHRLDLAVADASRPFKATLVWTEPPGASGADDPVVNDLDLIVTGPTGAVYRGNAFAGGVSVEGGVPDTRNNVEMVLVPAPTPGTWSVAVAATRVVASSGPQGFALAISGAFAPSQPA